MNAHGKTQQFQAYNLFSVMFSFFPSVPCSSCALSYCRQLWKQTCSPFKTSKVLSGLLWEWQTGIKSRGNCSLISLEGKLRARAGDSSRCFAPSGAGKRLAKEAACVASGYSFQHQGSVCQGILEGNVMLLFHGLLWSIQDPRGLWKPLYQLWYLGIHQFPGVRGWLLRNFMR